MDYSIKCSKCFNLVDKSDCFTKSVTHIVYHPDELRERSFCSTKCIKEYMEKNKNKEEDKKSDPCQIYDWGGGLGGY